jgi:tetratricopeptide (TPR) repeat protein
MRLTWRSLRSTLEALLHAPEAAPAAGRGSWPEGSAPSDGPPDGAAGPSDPLAGALGLCLQDRWTEGLTALRGLAGPRCRCPRTWRALGVAHGRLGDWRRAQAALEEERRLAGPGDGDDLLVEVRSIRRWQRAVERRPWDATAHGHLGVLLLAWEHGDAGLVHLERATALKPDWAEAHLHLGMERHYRGDLEAAERAYAEAVRLAPDDQAARRCLEALREGRLPVAETEAPAADPWRMALAV